MGARFILRNRMKDDGLILRMFMPIYPNNWVMDARFNVSINPSNCWKNLIIIGPLEEEVSDVDPRQLERISQAENHEEALAKNGRRNQKLSHEEYFFCDRQSRSNRRFARRHMGAKMRQKPPARLAWNRKWI